MTHFSTTGKRSSLRSLPVLGILFLNQYPKHGPYSRFRRKIVKNGCHGIFKIFLKKYFFGQIKGPLVKNDFFRFFGFFWKFWLFSKKSSKQAKIGVLSFFWFFWKKVDFFKKKGLFYPKNDPDFGVFLKKFGASKMIFRVNVRCLDQTFRFKTSLRVKTDFWNFLYAHMHASFGTQNPCFFGEIWVNFWDVENQPWR